MFADRISNCGNTWRTVFKVKIQIIFNFFKINNTHFFSKTFLESPLTDSKWFGIYAAFLALIWIVIMLWCVFLTKKKIIKYLLKILSFSSFRRVKAYIRSMNCFFIPLFICLVALFVKSIEVKSNNFLENIDWSLLQNADVSNSLLYEKNTVQCFAFESELFDF